MPQVVRGMRRVVVPTPVKDIQAKPRLADILRDWFFEYAANFTFAGNETQNATIQVQTDAHFLVVSSAYDTNHPAVGGFGAGINAQFGGLLVQLSDVATSRPLSNIPVPVSTLFGTAQRPFVWPFTHLFRAGGGIAIQATGIVAATAQTVRLVFQGYKLPTGKLPALGL